MPAICPLWLPTRARGRHGRDQATLEAPNNSQRNHSATHVMRALATDDNRNVRSQAKRTGATITNVRYARRAFAAAPGRRRRLKGCLLHVSSPNQLASRAKPSATQPPPRHHVWARAAELLKQQDS